MNPHGLELDFEVADRITILNLRECLDRMMRENNEIMALNQIEDHHLSDFKYNSNMVNHIRAVLRYFGEDF